MRASSLLVPLTLASLLLALPSESALGESFGGDVTVVLTATAGDPIEQINLSQTTPIFTVPIGADGLFAGALANPLDDGPILAVNAATVFGDADPFIDLDFDVTNTTPFNATVTVTALVPLSASFGPGLNVSAVSSVTVSDPPADGFYLGGVDGTSVFEGTVDGEIVATIFDSATSTVSQPSGGLAVGGLLTLPVSDYLPGATADESIGITSNFVLGPGDTLDFSGFFEVSSAVPEPSVLGMLLAGASALGFHRFR